jgi:hypothetical protein
MVTWRMARCEMLRILSTRTEPKLDGREHVQISPCAAAWHLARFVACTGEDEGACNWKIVRQKGEVIAVHAPNLSGTLVWHRQLAKLTLHGVFVHAHGPHGWSVRANTPIHTNVAQERK